VAIVAVLVLCLGTFAACSGDRYSRVNIQGDPQDTGYQVVGNGGSAVQYGNYIYFINGAKGYEDTDGKNNIFGEVEKGALYRAALLGDKVENDRFGNTFALKRDADGSGLSLAARKSADYKGDEIYVADVQLVAPKVIGTGGYAGGGIFIFDDYLYYASPHNLKDKSGNVKYQYTDFFRMSLDGKTTQKLYTTAKDTQSSPYNFYIYKDAVFVTVLEGTDLMSIKFDKRSGKKLDTMRLCENVTNAVMPVKPIYYNGISTDTIYDFIYIERSATRSDPAISGTYLEFMRPDGAALDPDATDGAGAKVLYYRGVIASDTANPLQLVAVRDGLLFYTATETLTQPVLKATNLHNMFYGMDKAYRDAANQRYNNGVPDDLDYTRTALAHSGLSGFTLYPYVAGYDFLTGFSKSNAVQVLAVASAESGGTLTLYRNDVPVKVFNGSELRVEAVKDGVLFYSAGAELYRADITEGSGDAATTISTTFAAGTYGADIAAGFLVYFADVEGSETAKSYAHFKEIDGLENNEFDNLFVGKLTEDEEPSPYKELVVVTMPAKTEYKKGEKKFDKTGLVIKGVYQNTDLEDHEDIEISDDMITGFDTATPGANTVTVTYERCSVTFELTVLEEEAGCGTLALGSGLGLFGAAAGLLAVGVLFVRKRRSKV
jgi:hypothetical protein